MDNGEHFSERSKMNSRSSTENIVSSGIRKRRKLTSDIWKYVKTEMGKEGAVRVCAVDGCGKSFSIKTSTGTLKNHLQMHGLFVQDAQKQTRLTGTGDLTTEPPKPIEEIQQLFERFLVNYIVADQNSFSSVELPEFENLIKLLNNDVNIPSRTTIQRRVLKYCEERRTNVRSILSERKCRISLTADAWSSRVYKGYMVVTGHWIDNDWVLRSIVLEFKRFLTPHTGDAACEFMYDVINDWGIKRKLMCITTDNASDMISGVRKLNMKITADLGEVDVELRKAFFHIRCISHIINLGVKECMKALSTHITQLRVVLNAMRSSVKRRDLFEEVCGELRISQELPSLDIETRWSSTFLMVKKMYEMRRAINVTVLRIPELSDNIIEDNVWEQAYKICTFLEAAASVTEIQSGSTYVTLSRSSKLLGLLISKCESAINSNDPILQPTARSMVKKLHQYVAICNTPLCRLA